MPKRVGSQDSHSSSLPSLSDHDSISSAASTHSTSSTNSGYWAHPPPHTHSIAIGFRPRPVNLNANANDTKGIMTSQAPPLDQHSASLSSSSSSGPQRSSTIKASSQPASSTLPSNHSSIITAPSRSKLASLNAKFDPTEASTLALLDTSSTSPPLLHPLVFPSSTGSTSTSTSNSNSNSNGTSNSNSNSSKYSTDKSARASLDRRLQDTYLVLDEAAPRLSMSSTGSGSTCELATPENAHQSWPYDHVDRSPFSALHSSSPSSLTQTPDNRKDAYSANLHMHNDEINLRPPSRETDARSVSLDKLAIQRPAKLERLSSAATNATAKNSVGFDESPQTATQSPRSFQAPDLASLRISSGAADPIASYDSSSQMSKSPSLSAHFPSRTGMTSPDSWRSLLPEHDPYFASEGQLSASQHERSSSPQCLHPSSGAAFDIDACVAAKTSPRAPINDRMSASSFDTARTSFSSAISGYSTMSMSVVVGPSKPWMQSQDSARSDSWRSLLPDDDRYHASRHTCTAAHHHQREGLQASPSLASPSLSDYLDSPVSFDGHNHRSAFFALQAPRATGITSASHLESAARRHSSFSSIDPSNSSQYAATRSMLASMKDNLGSFGSSSISASESFATRAAGDLLSLSATHSLDAPNMTPALSNSTEDDDSGERDSWPTSRGGRFSSPVSSGPMTPEVSQTWHSKSSLAQQAGGIARVDSPSHASQTSDSFVKTTPDGLLATTTTTTCKTTTSTTTTSTTTTSTSTTTQLLPEAAAASKAKSEVGFEKEAGMHSTQEDGEDAYEDVEGMQSQPMKARTSSCSISTPISPPSLPFLERRPAPPETDLVIETERTKYILITRLPGFSLDCITLATKQHSQHRTLHIVADKWDTESGGHFERRITFPDKECDLKNVKAEFDGNTLRVYVPRNRSTPNRFSSASSATF
ncbi:uncharacterized protein UHO2_01646 [Ustilago hordei]|nr:uncharacterized protein UHO2_01646 [Ustilago hordei]SYW85400.1 uncharacterized protein UHO2_01646 [Ustilago hordei]